MFTFIKKWFIPKGYYCYKPLRVMTSESHGFIMKTKTCPFYIGLGGMEGGCLLEHQIVTDQCKVCNIHLFTDKELEKMCK